MFWSCACQRGSSTKGDSQSRALIAAVSGDIAGAIMLERGLIRISGHRSQCLQELWCLRVFESRVIQISSHRWQRSKSVILSHDGFRRKMSKMCSDRTMIHSPGTQGVFFWSSCIVSCSVYPPYGNLATTGRGVNYSQHEGENPKNLVIPPLHTFKHEKKKEANDRDNHSHTEARLWPKDATPS